MKMRRNLKRFALLSCFLFILILITACGSKSPETAPVSGPSSSDNSQGSSSAPEQPEEKKSNYPEKDITIVVGSRPGGGYDTWARGVAPFLQKHLPNQVNILIKNEEGAAGKIAARELERANPDGYLLYFFNSALANSQGVLGEADYDVLKWTPVAQIASDIQIMAISPHSGYETVEDIINSPNKPVYASQGFTRAAGHAFLISANTFGYDFSFINHANGDEATMSALRGDTDIVFGSIESSLRFFEDGLIPFVYFGRERHPEIPDVPTAAEIGYPELTGLGSSRIFAAPPGLPEDILAILDETFAKVAEDPEFIAWAATQGYTVDYADSVETGEIIASYVKQGEDNREVLSDYIE